MFVRKVMLFYVCALLHFGGFECALVITPQNRAVVSGESTTLHCASNVSAGNILWITRDPGSSDIEIIYIQNITAPSVSSYISVYDREDGNCSLHINSSVTAAKRYICKEFDSGLEASAELIVLKSGVQCNSAKGSSDVNCFTVSAGNWAPVVECKEWKPDIGLNDLPGNQISTTVDNNVVTRTWNYISDSEWFHIFCEMTFKESERPKESSATNIPQNFSKTLAYNGTCLSHSGKMSDNSSAECPVVATVTAVSEGHVTVAAAGHVIGAVQGHATTVFAGSAVIVCNGDVIVSLESHMTTTDVDPVATVAKGPVTPAAEGPMTPVFERRKRAVFEGPVTDAAEGPVTAVFEGPVKAVFKGSVRTPAGKLLRAADEDPVEVPVGPGWIASVVLNCMLVPVLIGLAFAVYKGQSNKRNEDKKPKSAEQGAVLNDSDQASQEPSYLA